MKQALPQNLDQLDLALTEAGFAAKDFSGLVDRVHLHFRYYTELEKELLGTVPINFPAYLLETPLSDDPAEGASKVAGLERERLKLGDGAAGDIVDMLERQGHKVYRPSFPESRLNGFFLFDKVSGPVFVINRDLDYIETDYVATVLYGHFLMDHNPYRIELQVQSGEAASHNRLRASFFAHEFLISREGLESYLKALEIEPGGTLSAEIVSHLATYFEVGVRTMLSRLLTLGYLQQSDLEAMANLEVDLPERITTSSTVSERFTRLALEAHATGHLDRDQLAAYLETDRPHAMQLADQFKIPDEVEESGQMDADEAEDPLEQSDEEL